MNTNNITRIGQILMTENQTQYGVAVEMNDKTNQLELRIQKISGTELIWTNTVAVKAVHNCTLSVTDKGDVLVLMYELNKNKPVIIGSYRWSSHGALLEYSPPMLEEDAKPVNKINYGLTLFQYKILTMLQSNNSSDLNDEKIAKVVGCCKQTVTRTKEMAKKGLLALSV